MITRARRRVLLAWLPRGALLLTTLLAPVIDRGVDAGAPPRASREEAAEPPGVPGGARIVLRGAGLPEGGAC